MTAKYDQKKKGQSLKQENMWPLWLKWHILSVSKAEGAPQPRWVSALGGSSTERRAAQLIFTAGKIHTWQGYGKDTNIYEDPKPPGFRDPLRSRVEETAVMSLLTGASRGSPEQCTWPGARPGSLADCQRSKNTHAMAALPPRQWVGVKPTVSHQHPSWCHFL